MRDQELIGLYEAYQQVHTQQQVINQEVEIAAHYFYEMGLNEEGVDILIEELGAEEFAKFVYDISEEYVLTEARAGGVRIEPVTAKGTPFKSGKPTGKSLQRLSDKKAARRRAEAAASASKPSGMKAALQRQSAVSAAAKQQPKKPGLLDRVARAVLTGIKRHNAATDGMGAATRETAGKIGKAAGEFRKGLMSSYDNWVGQLISDGYDLSNWTDEGLFEYYEQLCEESLEKGQSPTPGGMIKPKTTPAIPPKPPKGTKVNTGYKESYDIVFDYLISEGYADTNEAAVAIMVNMSEDWRDMIVEEVLDEKKYEPDEKLPSGGTPREKAERKRGYHGANYMLRGREPGVGRNDQARDSHFNRGNTIHTVINAMDAGEEPHKDPKWKNTIAARRRPRSKGEVPNERPGGLRAHNTIAGGHRTLVRRNKINKGG